MSRTPEKDEKIRNILDSATNLFAQKGYHDVTMEEIAETVKVAKGTLYLYFPSKEELYWAILERGLHDLFRSLEQEAVRPVSPEEKLRAIMTQIFRYSKENSQFYRLFLREETKVSRTCLELLAPWRVKAFRLVEQILKEGIEKENFRPLDTQMLSVVLPGMVRSLIFFYEGAKEETTLINDMLDFIFHGIKGEGREG